MLKDVKYLKATDILEIQLSNVFAGKAPFSELAKIIIILIDILELHKAIVILCEANMQEVLFTSIKLLSWREGLEAFKEELILKMFTESV